MTDEQRIEQAQDDREYGHRDPCMAEHLDAVQTRYETYLGWHRD